MFRYTFKNFSTFFCRNFLWDFYRFFSRTPLRIFPVISSKNFTKLPPKLSPMILLRNPQYIPPRISSSILLRKLPRVHIWNPTRNSQWICPRIRPVNPFDIQQLFCQRFYEEFFQDVFMEFRSNYWRNSRMYFFQDFSENFSKKHFKTISWAPPRMPNSVWTCSRIRSAYNNPFKYSSTDVPKNPSRDTFVTCGS